MKPEGELARLNRLGTQAASEASRFNTHVNQSGRSALLRSGQETGWGRHKVSVVGRLAVSIAMLFAFQFAFFALSLPFASWLAIAAVLAVELGWWLLKRRKVARLKGQSATLQAQLHDLKQQEFDLRYLQAKQNGDLDRFTKQEAR